jgi:hypothetical protein
LAEAHFGLGLFAEGVVSMEAIKSDEVKSQLSPWVVGQKKEKKKSKKEKRPKEVESIPDLLSKLS